eukprot:scaffold60268_cov27-Tisochrysis_lutea.AAC.13
MGRTACATWNVPAPNCRTHTRCPSGKWPAIAVATLASASSYKQASGIENPGAVNLARQQLLKGVADARQKSVALQKRCSDGIARCRVDLQVRRRLLCTGTASRHGLEVELKAPRQ